MGSNKPYASYFHGKYDENDPMKDEPYHPLFNDSRPGWKVCVKIDGIECFLPLLFGREVDASIAAKSIEDVIDWDGDQFEISARLRKFGHERLRKMMTENLQW